MKTRFTKIVVPTLAIAIGAAIVGSISGTVAWYQYSTRVSTAYLGTSAGTAGNLKLRIKGTDNWLNSLTKEDIKAYLQVENIGQNIVPITAGNMSADAAIAMYDASANPGTTPAEMKPRFFKNPIRGYDERVDYSSAAWLKADSSMYVQIPLQVAFIEYDGVEKGEEDKEYLEKDVYISDLLIQEDYKNNADPENLKKDLSSAIRVHVSSFRDDDESANHAESAFDRLISKDGGTILTEGHLDLDGDDRDDTYIDSNDRGAQYGFGDSASIVANTKKVIYGEGVQVAYSAKDEVTNGSYKALDAQEATAEKVYPAVVKSVGNSTVLDENDFEYTKESASGTTSKCIGRTIGYDKTKDNWEQDYLNITLTIWLEGWQTLSNPTPADANAVSSIWNAADYIGSQFDVGIQFATQAE